MNSFQDVVDETFDRGIWRRILMLLKHEKKNVIFAMIFMMSEALLAALIPFFNRYAIDVFYVGQKTTQDIIIFGLIYAIIVILQAYFVYQFVVRSGKIEMSVSYKTRQDAMKKLQNLQLSYFDKTPTGWIMARVTSDIARLSEVLSWSIQDLVWDSFFMVVLIVVMLIANFKLALLVIVTIPLVYGVSAWFQKRILRTYRKVRSINSQITSGFSEGISGAKTTKTMALEQRNYQEFSKLTVEMKAESMHSIFLNALYVPIVLFLSAIGNAGVMWAGSEMVLNQVVQLGILVMLTQYANQFFEPLRNISGILAQMKMAQASAERILALLEEKIELIDTPEVIAKYGTILEPKEAAYDPIIGQIEFRDVSFHYIAEEPILKHFNLVVEPKQRIALVGETGSGKSTIVNLICRFYEPIAGEVLIDGKDYRERSLGWLHSHLGYVLQAPHLFSGTVKDNIRYGRLDASDEEIITAAKLVDAHAFIMNLEDGYDTQVGEGGGRLSTGQKQLISFARALIVNPALFVLDEATSSIDTETEAIIQHAINHVLKDKTSFIIAHRLSTIVNADRILVIQKGEIIEDGTHAELLEKQGYYYRLYTQQFNENQQEMLLETLSQE